MTDPHGFTPGEILAGKYRVERILGEGGMGVVIAAHHVELDERVAIKFLLPVARTDADAVTRFGREARAAVKIKSEHVARVSDVGQLPDLGPYMVMEYLDGIDLAVWLKQRGPLPVDHAVDFILQACEALAEAHAIGIVHRDLKPGNLFCIQRADGQPSIKILDFGISKITTGAPHDLTRTNTMFGSPAYMSPEQVRSSRGVDTRTDIWSLGVILFELVARVRPFRAESITELAVIIAQEPAPRLTSVRADLPPLLDEVIARCLEKDRDKRFQDVGALAEALEPLGTAPRARASVERIQGTLRKASARLGPVSVPAPSAPSSPAPEPAPAGVSQPEAVELSVPILSPSASTAQLAKTSREVAVDPPVDPAIKTTGEWGRTDGRPALGSAPPPRARSLALAAIAVTLAVLAGAVTVLLRGSPTPATETTRVDAHIFEAGPPRLASASAAVPPTELPSVETAPPVATTSPAPLPSPAITATVPAAPPKPPGRATKPTRSDCDPPYTLSPKGARVFKEQCL